MEIIVLVKQVPETSNARMDAASGTVVREGAENIVNPLDLYAVEIALRLKENLGARVTALTMGPESAKKCLKEAMAMGCDDGILLSAREFAGSDTLATSRALAAACRKIGFDLIIAGERATDGDTAQVAPEVSALLDVPVGAYVSKVLEADKEGLIVERLLEKGWETLSLPYPCLLSVLKEAAVPRLPTLRGKQRARAADITAWTLADLDGLSPAETGFNGSPTRVVKIEPQKVTRSGVKLKASETAEIENAVEALIGFLREKNLIAGGGAGNG